VEAFACKEITNFSSKYFSHANNVNAHTTRYHIVEELPLSELSIFQWKGKGVGAPSAHYVTNDEWSYTILYMYTNMEEVQPYFDMFDKTLEMKWTTYIEAIGFHAPARGQRWSKFSEVVAPTCNFLLRPFSFLVVIHLSHASNCHSSITPLYVVMWIGTRGTTPHRLKRPKEGPATTRPTIEKIPEDHEVLPKA
jgi:hypothetical protein